MRFGVVIPHDDLESPEEVREFFTTVENLGFDYVLAYDHPLGADAKSRPDWRGDYDAETRFQEPLVLFAFVAAITSRIELATGVLVLPQRQTALVAKQAADVSLLSGGRLCLGVGLGWNRVEYEAMGVPFERRAVRLEEQVDLLRALLAEPIVDFTGEWHRVDRAGINPLPTSPVPIWIGGHADVALARAARIGDGLVTYVDADAEGKAKLDLVRRTLQENDRDPATFPIRGRVVVGDLTPDQVQRQVAAYEDMGVTELSLNTMTADRRSTREHLELLRSLAESLLTG